jgi:hypothetical protein
MIHQLREYQLSRMHGRYSRQKPEASRKLKSATPM